MADSNSQHHRTVAGDEDALFESRVVEEPEPISSEFPVLNQNATNDDEDGVQNCTFTQLLSTGHFCLCETMIFFYRVIVTYP
ncbi:hypothetical protein HanIR_Chr03g0131161 [Helianthus annuus]|nr:hypothetical protein HanIR_Chr03g0131161 [Helianthus annuus]